MTSTPDRGHWVNSRLGDLSAACFEGGGRETGISASGEDQTIISKACLSLECAVKLIHKYSSNSEKN